MSRCQFEDCRRTPAKWTVDPERPAFAYVACAEHALEALADGWNVDGPEIGETSRREVE